MSQYNYVITIKEPDYKRVNAVTFLMLLIAIVFFIYVTIHQWASKYHNAAIMDVVIITFIVLWSVYTFFSSQQKNKVAYYRLALFAAAIGWFAEPISNYWMAGLFVIAALLERQVKFPQEIGVDEHGITFNTLPQKEYEWKDIKNVLLKEGILTVDYKNNKLFQHAIESDVNPALEREFNQYCGTKLAVTQR
ncbi:MAG: hypothetical protein M3R72_03370 [Bacteroidota bacterium]|nr:hypothetical protein [Bacteroidota bacterium]